MDNRSPKSRKIMPPRPTPSNNSKDSHKIIKKPPLAPQPWLQPLEPAPPQLHHQELSQPQPPLAPQPRLQPLEPAPPQLHHQELSQPQPQPPRGPVIIYIRPSKIIHTRPDNFKALVQRLTGKPSTSTTSSSSSQSISATNDTSAAFDASRGWISPAAEYAAMEKANASNEVGFVGSAETTDFYQHHHHQNRDMEMPNFYPAPGPTSLPLISPGFFSTVGPTDPQDGYWNQQRQHQPPMSSIPHGGPPKRPRSDFGHDMHSYVSRDEDRGIPHSVKDTRTIGSVYDLCLQNVQTSSIPSEEVGRFDGVGLGRRGGDSVMPSPSMGELMTGRGGILPPDFGPNGRALGFGQQDLVGRPSRELLHLPPDASNTLYLEGLPSTCSRRDVAHIFRRFLGYKEVRLVTKDSTQRNGYPIVLCFVDFENPECAATARTAMQGRRVDEDDPDSKILQIQFSRNPDPRPGQHGGRR